MGSEEDHRRRYDSTADWSTVDVASNEHGPALDSTTGTVGAGIGHPTDMAEAPQAIIGDLT